MAVSQRDSTEAPAPNLDAEVWCDECGELGWEGICPACRELPPPD